MLLLLARATVILIYCIIQVTGQNLRGVSIGYPEKWTGDEYKDEPCEIRGFPHFLDGYFVCQLSAAYGKEFDSPGQKLTHMIDAMGAIGSFHLNRGQVSFSGAYYPARPFKVWDFYDRDLQKSSVAWNAGWSPWNKTAAQIWEPIQDPDMVMFHPNVDFWKIGRQIVGGTESPYWVGLGFDVPTLDNFKKFAFIDTNEIFRNPDNSPIKLLNMPIHERTDENGVIWASTSAFNPIESRMYQIVFSVASSGLRTIEGMHDYGRYDLSQCNSESEYLGDKGNLAGYMHSITSTEQYVILPITSSVINPCKWFRDMPFASNSSINHDIEAPGSGLDFDTDVPMRFLVFNKRTKRFETQTALEVYPSMWVSHQWNAYEKNDGSIVADMLAYDNADAYNKYMYVDFLKRQPYPAEARPLRFTIDLKNKRVKYDYLVPEQKVSMEFPQFNHAFEGRPYKYGYAVVFPFSAGSRIIKMNMDEPEGRNTKYFSPGPNFALSEPWFVSRPGYSREDDGVLLVRAIDTQAKKGVLFAVDARTMTEEGRATTPEALPFGFHNRYYSRRDLGLPPGKTSQFYPRPKPAPKAFVTRPPPLLPRTTYLPPIMRRTPLPHLPIIPHNKVVKQNRGEQISSRRTNIYMMTKEGNQHPYSKNKNRGVPTTTDWSYPREVDRVFPPRTYPANPPSKVIPLIPSFPKVDKYVPPRAKTTTTTEKPKSITDPEFPMFPGNLPNEFKNELKKIGSLRPRERGVHLKPGDLSGMYDRGRRALCGWFREIFVKMGSDFCFENRRKNDEP